MKKCKTCKYWNTIIDDLIGGNSKEFGTCESDKWNINPNYYTESEKVTKIDMINITYQPTMGRDFGCIHHKENNIQDGQVIIDDEARKVIGDDLLEKMNKI